MNRINIEASGIPLVDKTWGGFYIGGTYFLIGPPRTGKTILGIQYARECVRQKQVCLYFTGMKPKDLLMLASNIDFDMKAFIDQDLIIVIKIALPTLSNDFNKHDEELSIFWNEIIRVLNQYKVDRIIFDDFTPFIGFNKLNSLTDAYHNTIEIMKQNQTTNLFILSDPESSAKEGQVNTVLKEGNGVIYINKDKQEDGDISIKPIQGYHEGQFRSKYTITSYGGMTVDFIDPSPVRELAKGKIKRGNTNGYWTDRKGPKNLFND